jgi:predicted RNA-binding Zn-ribbon protein involved in translation (DUF1610 family)
VTLAGTFARLSDLVERWVSGLPPRCPACGARASEVEEEELLAVPPIVQVVYRCPRCGRVAACRTIGVPDE